VSDFVEELRAAVGRKGTPSPPRDPVNQPMIRHWCDAMDDRNPVYVDPSAAEKSVHGGIVAPPAMLQAWGMIGLAPAALRPSGEDTSRGVYARLDAAGFTSVVATDCGHEYARYLRQGDEPIATASVVDVSDEKQTALGVGHFVTTRTEYHARGGEYLGAMDFRILKFKPGTGRVPAGGGGGEDASAAPARLKPGISRDTRFFWEGLQEGELRIQRCERCGALHHPPMVRCPKCGSYELGHTVASGRGRVYSFVEVHHPRVPGFRYPLVVVLVELDEGTRLLSNIVACEPEQVEIGMPVELVIDDRDPELAVPTFRPLRPERRVDTLTFDAVQEGDVLGPCPIPITPTLIVSTAIASRDYQDVHHDRDLAKKRGSPDIFMNILTSGGLCARYVTDWAGPEALLRSLKIRLGVPNYPYDTMTMTGSVLAKELRDGKGLVDVGVRGYNGLGNHVTGTLQLELPR